MEEWVIFYSAHMCACMCEWDPFLGELYALNGFFNMTSQGKSDDTTFSLSHLSYFFGCAWERERERERWQIHSLVEIKEEQCRNFTTAVAMELDLWDREEGYLIYVLIVLEGDTDVNYNGGTLWKSHRKTNNSMLSFNIYWKTN